jgi:hypothetical protein
MKSVPIVIIVIVLIIFTALLYCEIDLWSHKDSAPSNIQLPDGKRLAIVNFEPDEEFDLREALKPLFTAKCGEAFHAAGLRSPEEAVERGVIIQPSRELYNHSAAQLGLTSEETRRAYAEEFSSLLAQGGTIPPFRGGVQLITDGKPRIFIHESAFIGESCLHCTFSLNGVLAHEFQHVGGQPRTPGRLGALRHDLAGFPYFDRILDACR